MKILAQMHKALSEEIRLRIVMLLMQGELCVCDLMTIFEQSQSKISRHLSYLKHSGLIKGRRDGVWMHYFLNEPLDDPWASQLNLMKEKFSRLTEFRLDRETLTELKKQGGCKAVVESKTGKHRRSTKSRENRI